MAAPPCHAYVTTYVTAAGPPPPQALHGLGRRCAVLGCAQFTWGAAAVLTAVFCIIWPVMTIPAGVFSLGYFYFFIILSLAWGLVRTPFSLPLFARWTNHLCQWPPLGHCSCCRHSPSQKACCMRVGPCCPALRSIVCSACSCPLRCCLHALHPGVAVLAAGTTGKSRSCRAGGVWPWSSEAFRPEAKP